MIGDLKLLNLIGSHFLKLNIFKKKKKQTNKQIWMIRDLKLLNLVVVF